MFKFLVLCLTLAVASAIPLSNEGISPFLTNGTQSKAGEFPFLVQITISNSELPEGIYESGVLISDKYVLARAGSLTPGNMIHVLLGTLNPGFPGTGQLNQVLYDDIVFSDNIISGQSLAILKLLYPVTLSELVQPVLLPRLSEKGTSYDFQRGTVAGWIGSNALKRAAHQTAWINENYWCSASTLDPIVCVPDEIISFGDEGAPLTIETEDGQVLVGIYAYSKFHQRERIWSNNFIKINEQLEFIAENTDIEIRP